MRTRVLQACLVHATLVLPGAIGSQQVADTAWHAVVVRPAFASNGGPRIAIDAAHRNFHTVDGGYRPLAELLRADGFRVTGNERRFDSASLRGLDVLIIANARGALGPGAVDASAFTPEEISALRDWIRGGGSLLLVADHAPFGAASAALGNAFGVEMSQGVTMDTTRSHPGNRSFLRFSRSQGDLGDHRILSGRDSSERISEVMTFSGQSLSLPKGAAPLLKLSASAEDLPPPSRAEADARAQRLKALRDSLAAARRSDTVRGDSVFVLRDSTRRGMRGVPKTAAGRVQGLAFREGRGRVVILGEAAALSAQVIDIPGFPRTRMGMNVPGNDNQQFALNVVRWLARVLD